MITNSTHFNENILISFFLVLLKKHIVYVHHDFFYLSADGYLGLFYFLTIMSSASVTMDVQVSLSYVDLQSIWYIPR